MSRACPRVRLRLGDERGAVAVLVAGMMVVILGMSAMAIDFGWWWSNQRHLQTQADAGALAGADTLLANPTSCPGTITTVADQYASPNTTTAGSDAVPTGTIGANGENGKVTATTSVACPGSGSYVDVKLNNSNPGSFFSGLDPTISAHARVSLLQIGQAGGSTVLPYAITQSDADQGCCGTSSKLIKISVNAGGAGASQSLDCDLSGSTQGTAGGGEMKLLEENGCNTTQISANSTTCAVTNPPSCLPEFTGVAETDYDLGEVFRFENGFPNGAAGGPTCASANGSPVSTDYWYLLPTVKPNDPRLITIFVVPNNSFSTAGANIPIVGYASFYVVGWDHDPCVEGTAAPPPAPPGGGATSPLCATTFSSTWATPPAGTSCDLPDPGPGGDPGSLWGYFVQTVVPASSGEIGTKPCNPQMVTNTTTTTTTTGGTGPGGGGPGSTTSTITSTGTTTDASTADCVAQMTQ